MMDIQFRRAKIEDAERAVPLIHAAAPAMFDFVYESATRTAQDFLRYAFASDRGFLSYRHQQVGLVDGALVFSITSYRAAQFRALGWDMVQLARVFYRLRELPRLISHATTVSKLFASPNPESQFLANAGVAPTLRSQGIFSRFLEHTVPGLAADGVPSIELDVSMDNPNAERLYRRLGFEVDVETRYAGKHPLVGVKRMVRPLP